MKTLSIFMSVALILLSASGVAGQQHIAVKVEPVAMESLAVFKSLMANQQNYRQMGFVSPEDASRMTLGIPMQVYMVPLDRLQSYAGGISPQKLLTDTRHFIYPVHVDNQIRSSLTMAEIQGVWKAVSFGSPTLIRKIGDARMTSVGASGTSTVSHFLVRDPRPQPLLSGIPGRWVDEAVARYGRCKVELQSRDATACGSGLHGPCPLCQGP